MERDGYIKNFGEDCVEWFINEMLEIGYTKNHFKNEIEINLETIRKKNMIKLLVGYVKKNSNLKMKKKIQLLKTTAI